MWRGEGEILICNALSLSFTYIIWLPYFVMEMPVSQECLIVDIQYFPDWNRWWMGLVYNMNMLANIQSESGTAVRGKALPIILSRNRAGANAAAAQQRSHRFWFAPQRHLVFKRLTLSLDLNFLNSSTTWSSGTYEVKDRLQISLKCLLKSHSAHPKSCTRIKLWETSR